MAGEITECYKRNF